METQRFPIAFFVLLDKLRLAFPCVITTGGLPIYTILKGIVLVFGDMYIVTKLYVLLAMLRQDRDWTPYC